jgi:hypothetical protein
MSLAVRTTALLLLTAACSPEDSASGDAGTSPTSLVLDVPAALPPFAGRTPSVPTVPVGKSLTISFSVRTTVHLHPGKAKQDGKSVCTLGIEQSGLTRQDLVTVGQGDTEALTCGKLVAAGRIPAPKTIQRIALLYEVYGPHETILQPVILMRAGSTMLWETDDVLAQRIGEDAQLVTIPAIRRWAQSH